MGLLEVSCVDPDAHISAGGIGIGIFLAVAALFANVPQGLKIIRLNSSNGLSPTTMACVVVHNVLVLADMVVVKWRILQSCAGAAGHCLFRLLDCIQQSGTVLTQALILGLFTMYPPNCVARYRAVALLTTLLAAALVTASAVASLSGERIIFPPLSERILFPPISERILFPPLPPLPSPRPERVPSCGWQTRARPRSWPRRKRTPSRRRPSSSWRTCRS